MKVENGKKITIEYELSLDEGTIVESSATRGPVEYIHGSGRMLAGLEKQIEGLTIGDEKTGTIPAVEAYGTDQSLPTRELLKSDFPSDEEIEIGKHFTAKDIEGSPVQFKIVKVTDQSVTVQFEHPLTGKDINFKVKILDIADVQ